MSTAPRYIPHYTLADYQLWGGDWELIGDLVIPNTEEKPPVVLLLNKANGNREVYRTMANYLSDRGIASLRLDLRGHGESTNVEKFIPGIRRPDPLIWDSEVDHDCVNMKLTSPHLDNGFPGALNMKISFSVSDANELILRYECVADIKTPVSFTNHSYFNLSGFTENIFSHTLDLRSKEVFAKDDCMCAQSIVRVNEPLDFKETRVIESPLDDYFICDQNDDQLKYLGSLSYQNRKMEILTTEHGAQLYTADHVSSKLGRNTKEQYGPNCALAIETSRFPNGMNLNHYESCYTTPERPFKSETVYKFSW